MPSCPYHLVAVEATTIDCASIILPMTPPDELAAAISTGLIPQLFGADLLQTAEKHVGGRIGAGQRHAKPADHCTEEGVEGAGLGECKAKGRVSAGILGDEPERQHAGDRQQRVADEMQRAAVHFDEAERAITKQQAGEDRREEDARAGGREQIERVNRCFRRRLGDHRRNLQHQIMQTLDRATWRSRCCRATPSPAVYPRRTQRRIG